MKTILSVDDERIILDCMRDALQVKGYRVLTTPDPHEGLRMLIERGDIDLAILDIKMPGMTGFDLYRRFRRQRKVPVLFLTAYPKSFNLKSNDVLDMWQTEFADGTTDIMYKPFDLSVLYEKIAGLIGPAEEDGGTP
ncbi:MAG: response regulator [Lentisphaerae bacterium]|nr:response regulator [Lentisphaerota bacterium]